MSLNDWEIYRDGGELVSDPKGLVHTDISTPIFGTGSVTLTHAPTTEFQNISLVPATSPTGFVAGRMRTLIRLDNFSDDGIPTIVDENYVGLLCMQSVENMSSMGIFGGVGQCYGAAITITEGFSTQSIRLYKFIAGIDGSSGRLPLEEILESVTPPFPLISGMVVAFELVWRADPLVLADFGGAFFVVRIGQANDFSNLQEVFTHIDANDPYTVSVAESIFVGFKNISSLSANRVTFDQTSLFRTAVT